MANKEVVIPYYHYNCKFLYSEKRGLPIVQEYVLEFLSIGLSLKEIELLLGLGSEVINDAFYRLMQNDFINPHLEITETGVKYLESHSINNLEKGELEILVNSFTGDIDASVNNSILHQDVKQYCCYKAHIKTVEPDDLDFKQMSKVLRTYCEKNELNSECKLIDVIDLTKKSTKYRKIDLLIYQNPSFENRIMVIENGKKKLKTARRMRSMRTYYISMTQMDMIYFSSLLMVFLKKKK